MRCPDNTGALAWMRRPWLDKIHSRSPNWGYSRMSPLASIASRTVVASGTRTLRIVPSPLALQSTSINNSPSLGCASP